MPRLIYYQNKKLQVVPTVSICVHMPDMRCTCIVPQGSATVKYRDNISLSAKQKGVCLSTNAPYSLLFIQLLQPKSTNPSPQQEKLSTITVETSKLLGYFFPILELLLNLLIFDFASVSVANTSNCVQIS